MVTFEDMKSCQDPRVLVPTESYDHLGIFSGSAISNGYKGYPTIMYTSVQHLPIGWNVPYQNASETQSIVYSQDGGKSWIRPDVNPVIGAPPFSNVTGFRDTLAFRAEASFEKAFGNKPNNTIYTLISSGLRGNGSDAGPRVLLYRGNDDMTSWNYDGILFAPPQNSSYSAWSGNFGFNFEMSGYFSLGNRSFITMGTEGARSDHGSHWPLWVSGSIQDRKLQHDMVGVIDWGEVYAINTFKDAKNRRILWAWTYEDDNAYGMLARGWQGSLVLPRVMTVQTITDVVGTESDLKQNSSWVANPTGSTWTITTLGMELLPELARLRKGSRSSKWTNVSPRNLTTTNSNAFEMIIKSTSPKMSISLRRSTDGKEHTDITYDSETQQITINRLLSSPYSEFNNATETGKFRLFNRTSGMEPLQMHIYSDGSVLEIHANKRFSLTTRIYPSEESRGISLLMGQADIELYDGLMNAWPSRPRNTSVPLQWDGLNYTSLWAGY